LIDQQAILVVLNATLTMCNKTSEHQNDADGNDKLMIP
jgi:hypothetical protein